MHNAYLVIPPSYITILLLRCDASQHEPLRLAHSHMQDELCLQCYFIFYVDDDSECLTGHGPRSLSALWAASATQVPISYLLCMERDRLGVHVSWTICWTIFWDERHNMATANVSSSSPGVLYFPTVKWGTRKTKTGCHCSPIYFKGQLSDRSQVVDDERLLWWCLKGKKNPKKTPTKPTTKLHLERQ